MAFSIGRLDFVAPGDDRKEFGTRVACRTFKYRPISYQIPVSIGSKIWVFHRGHVRCIQNDCRIFHRTCNLVNYIFNCISVAEYPTFIDVSTDKKNFRNDRIQTLSYSGCIDCLYL